jgi:hypothetical protein
MMFEDRSNLSPLTKVFERSSCRSVFRLVERAGPKKFDEERCFNTASCCCDPTAKHMLEEDRYQNSEPHTTSIQGLTHTNSLLG